MNAKLNKKKKFYFLSKISLDKQITELLKRRRRFENMCFYDDDDDDETIIHLTKKKALV